MFSSPGHPHRQKNSTSVAFARHKSRDCVVRGQFFFTPRRFGLFSRGFILWESVAWRNMRPAAWDRLNKMQCAAYLFRCIRHRSQLFFCDMFSREGIRWRRHVFVQLVSHCPASRFCFSRHSGSRSEALFEWHVVLWTLLCRAVGLATGPRQRIKSHKIFHNARVVFSDKEK